MDEASSNSWCSGAAVRVSRSSQFRGVGLPEGDGHRAGGDVAVTGGESIRVVAPSHTGRMDMAKGEGEDATNARPLVPSNEQPSDIMRPCSASACTGSMHGVGGSTDVVSTCCLLAKACPHWPTNAETFHRYPHVFPGGISIGLDGSIGGSILLFKRRGTRLAFADNCRSGARFSLSQLDFGDLGNDLCNGCETAANHGARPWITRRWHLVDGHTHTPFHP